MLQDDKEEGETGLLNVLDRIRTLNQDWVQFFAQLATLIPAVRVSPLQDNDEDIYVPESRHFWRRVLQWLVTRNKWRGVYCLFNPREIQPEDGQWSPLHGRAIGLSVDEVRVCDLLQSTNSEDLRIWGICLAIWFLKQGARIELISSAEGESITIAAVKTSLNAGMSELLSYVIEMRPELTLSLDDADQSGDSPLHLCVKFQQPDAESGAAVVLQTLLDLGCCTSVKDRQFRTPIQYVEEPDPRYTMLSHAANHAGTGLKDRVWKMKKLGDDHFQKDEFETSLSWYKKALVLAESAPNMKMEHSLLYCSCSCVYANLAVLEDKDVPTASSQMYKELCERKDDLVAVLTNIKNQDVTPTKEATLADRDGQEEKTEIIATEVLYVSDINNLSMKSDEDREELLQINVEAIPETQDLLKQKVPVDKETFEDEQEGSDEDPATHLHISSDAIEELPFESDVNISDTFNNTRHMIKTAQGKADGQSKRAVKKDEQVLKETTLKDECQAGKTDKEDQNLSEESDTLIENESKVKDGQLEIQSMENDRSDESLPVVTIQKSEPDVKVEVMEIKNEDEARATGKVEEVSAKNAHKKEIKGKVEEVSAKNAHKKEITERMDEKPSSDKDIKVENQSEESENEDLGDTSFIVYQRSSQTALLDICSSEPVEEISPPNGSHQKNQYHNNHLERDNEQSTVYGLCDDSHEAKSEDTTIPNATASQVSETASNPFSLYNDSIKHSKEKKSKKTSTQVMFTDGQRESNQNDRQDENETISSQEKRNEQENTEHQHFQMKTISECKRSIIRAIQDHSSLLLKEKGHEPVSITMDSTEVDRVDHTDDPNEMAVDNYEELANIDAESFDKATWEIECTANAWKQLKEDNVPMSLRQQIIKHVQQLAFGEWKDVPCKKIQGMKNTYETKVFDSLDVFMVWEIAVAFSGRCSDDPEQRLKGKSYHITGGRVYTEIIRIWGFVFSESDVRELAKSISKSHKRAEDCLLKKHLKILDATKCEIQTNKRIPRQFSEKQKDEQLKTIQFCPPASPNETEYHILKFYAFSSALVNILLHADTKRVDLPFKVTHREHAIIHLQSETPILLLGRSGTGKTTCCLYRLWNNFISYWQVQEGKPFFPRLDYLFRATPGAETEGEDGNEGNPAEVVAITDGKVIDIDPGNEDDDDTDAEEEDDYGEYDNLHQIFVTKNPVLCHEVKKNFLEFCSAHEETLEHVEAATTEIPAILQDVSDLSYPLFLTSKKLLLMLDASLGPPHFFSRNNDGSLKMKVDGWEDGGEENTLLLHPNSDDEDDYRHAAEPEHFTQPVRRKEDPRKEVTYDVFVDKVWPKLQKKIGVKYHPSLVWTEMISFIMGSHDSLFEQKGFLSEAKYLEIGKKRAPNFSGDRRKIYELFLRYIHYKTQHHMFDEADLVRHIFQRLNKMPELPWVLHQLYVDETQDFTQSELSVLLRITQDPNKMFLTGDTAQGIMRGISFRFCDLKSLFHQTKTSLETYQKRNLNEPKEVYQLIHSYRSHVGILSLASSVLELMVEFFPKSFDRLKKDQGLFHGPKPILLESCSVEDLMVLMQGNNRDTSHIEFGAHQAILVVNQDSKMTMPDILYDNSIVLTIFESKGLEFDDVLLYNFFTDSEASKEWRVVTQYLESISKQESEGEDLDNVQKIDHEMLRQPHRPRALDFDPTQHKVLNSELKNLYTALTRARVNVWLFDEDEDKRAPMFDYFKARMLVRSGDVLERGGHKSGIQKMVFAMKSSKSDWVKRGDEMMAKLLYDTAAKCYEMGFDEDRRNLALAYSQAQRGKQMMDSPQEMKDAFIRAADMFFQCGEVLRATQCLQNAQEFELAATSYYKMDKLLDAARMFQSARNFTKACECFIGINQYDNAVHMLDKAERFEEAIDCLKQYEEKVKLMRQSGNDVLQELIGNKPKVKEKDLWRKLVQSLHIQQRKVEMLKALRNLPREEHLEFLEKHKYYKEAAELMLEDGKNSNADAAEMLLGYGIFKLAIEYAERDKDFNMRAKCHQSLALNMMSEQDIADNQDVRDKIMNHLKQAKAAYQKAGNRNGVAMSVYHLSRLTRRIRDANEAYKLFQAETSFPNKVGMIESWLIVVKSTKKYNFHKCKKMIPTIHDLLSVIRTLLEDSDLTKKTMYMQFYGLHEKDMETKTLLFYPNHSPLCADIIPNFYKKYEKREKMVCRDAETMSFQISVHLGRILKYFDETCRKSLNSFATQSLQCRSFIEGLGNTCNNANCEYLHEAYNKTSAHTALETMLWKVNLEGILSQRVKGIKYVLKGRWQGLKQSLPLQSYDSCIEFLDFLMSPHCYPGWFSDSKELIRHPTMNFVKRHLKSFLSPRKEKNIEKLCASVEWIMKAFTFNALYGLEIDMYKECHSVEIKVKQNKECLNKENQLAFSIRQRNNESVVELFGRKFLYACKQLQQDAGKAVFSYTNFVKILNDRNKLLSFQKWPLFLFWHETFLTIALVTLTKMSEGLHCVIPASYLNTLTAVDVCHPNCKIQKIINDTEMDQSLTEHFQRRIFCFAAILCGNQTEKNLLKHLFNVAQDSNPPDFLLFERCFVLALVILANVGMASPLSIQDELMKIIKTIDPLECFPKRLEYALKETQNAKGTADVVAALHKLLQNRENEKLFHCKWMWNPHQNKGIEREQITRFEMFLTTFPSELEDGAMVIDADHANEKAVYEADDEDLELDDDDLREEQMYEQVQLEDTSAKIIQTFFKKIIFRGRLESGNLRQKFIRQQFEDLLVACKVTKTVCGICSVALINETGKPLEEVKLQTNEKIAEEPAQDVKVLNDSCREGIKECEIQPRQENLETFHVHVSSPEHQENARCFTAFKELYEEYFLVQVPEVYRFVASLRNKQLFIKNLQEQLGTFDYMIDVVSFLLTSILRDRKWDLVADLRSGVIPLCLYYKKASEEAEMWTQQYMQFRQHPYYQKPSDDYSLDEMQPAMIFGGTDPPYHQETLDGDQGFDLVNVEYQPSEGSFGQHDDNQIFRQQQRVHDCQNDGDEHVENRNWEGRKRGGENRRKGDRRFQNRGGNDERRHGQPRRYRGRGDRQPRGNGGRDGEKSGEMGRGQRGARDLLNLPPRFQNQRQQLQRFNKRIHNPNAD